MPSQKLRRRERQSSKPPKKMVTYSSLLALEDTTQTSPCPALPCPAPLVPCSPACRVRPCLTHLAEVTRRRNLGPPLFLRVRRLPARRENLRCPCELLRRGVEPNPEVKPDQAGQHSRQPIPQGAVNRALNTREKKVPDSEKEVLNFLLGLKS